LRIPAVLLLFGLTGFLQAVDFKLGGAREVPPPIPRMPKQQFLPDGHLTVFQDDSEVWMFWPFEDSYRTSGPSVFEMRDPVKSLPRGKAGSFDSGGAWLYTVLRGKEGRLLGFYHAEDRTFPLSPESNFIAYKSIARCTSDDFGESWKNREQILTSLQPKPQRAKWSGLGDHCIVWDHDKHRLVCFYQEGGLLHMAESRDSQGQAGTWRKWYRGDFTEPGLGGRSTPIPSLARHPGGNPSLLWNTFLERWLMALLEPGPDGLDAPENSSQKTHAPREGLVSDPYRQFRQDRRRNAASALCGIPQRRRPRAAFSRPEIDA
jgi:hypothetical protein